MDGQRNNPYSRPNQPYRRPNEDRNRVGGGSTGDRPIRYGDNRTQNNNRRPPLPRDATPKAFFPRFPDLKVTDDMQVTDGKHRGLQLKSTLSPKVRPTARRIREALFGTLNKRVRFSRFLDLCAGSGAVGVEAISRGALLGTFVERSAKMCHFIEQNLKTCEICKGHGEIHQIEISPFLKRAAKRKRCWDIIYFDPPYQADYDEVLSFFARGKCINERGGIFIIEHHADMFFPPEMGVLTRRKVVIEGECALTFYERTRK